MHKLSGLCFAVLLVASAAQAKSRDPFIPNVNERNRPHPTRVVSPTPAEVPSASLAVRKARPVTVAPAVAMQGVVMSSRGNKAILKSEKGTYIVSRGDRLGDFTVAAIDASSLTLRHKDGQFRIPLAK